jgi:hypothetical protein
VFTNSRPAFRKDDQGLHAACCNTNMWKAVQGSGTVFINNKEAVRQGDQTKHCGGSGNMIEGSNNVMIGGAAGSGGGGGSGGGSASAQAGGGNRGAQGSQSGTNSNQTGAGGTSAGSATAGSATAESATAPPSSASDEPAEDDEPQPVLVSAKWSQDRVPVSTEVSLSATCGEMAGASATFTIKDADDETKTIATVSGSCGESNVEATWTTPKDGPPGRFVFTVAADGKEASSGVLVLINLVEVTLFLDEEPAANVPVKLRADPGGEVVTAQSDERGVVTFEKAPFGDYTLFLDDGEAP